MDKESYKFLITTGNSRKPKYYGWRDGNDVYHIGFVDIPLDEATALGTVIESFDESFDLSNAAGAQLDIIGELVGMNRMLKNVPTIGAQQMDDEEYKLMIMLKIARNTWNGSNGDANKIYSDVFKNSEVRVSQEDNQDMTVRVEVYGAVSVRQTEILMYTDALLIPAGVGYIINRIGDEIDVVLDTGAIATGALRVDGAVAEMEGG